MSEPEDNPQPRKRRRKKLADRRVRLSTCGPWVRRDVDDLLRFWQRVHGIPIGRVVDAMVDYIKERDDFRIKILPWRSNSTIKGLHITESLGMSDLKTENKT
jgi:hypothetical protein